MGIVLHSCIVFLKNLTFLLFWAKCAIAQIKCFKKWKNLNFIISVLLRDISRCKRQVQDKESKNLSKQIS